MNYKLAKQLKDSGFPQELKEKAQNCVYYHKDGEEVIYPFAESKLHEGAVKKPTLEEVIEELGVRFGKSIRLFCNFRLKEYGVQLEEQGLDGVEWCKTPLEAVSNLYIKLNK